MALLKNDDLRAAFKRLERVYQAKEGTPAADEMEILVTLIEAYEQKHFPVGLVDPVEAIKFRPPLKIQNSKQDKARAKNCDAAYVGYVRNNFL